MSTAALGVTAGIDSALRKGFSEASVRLAPETRITDVIAALTAMGVSAAVEDGLLVLSQGDTQMHTGKALRNFAAKPEHTKFFVAEGSHPSQWSQQKKVEYLRTHTDEDYRKLVQSPALEAGVKTMDPNMSKAEYLALTRQEKLAFIREFSDKAVSKIMAKAK